MAAKLTIRPPPHVDWVVNWPGIAPSPSSPAAESFGGADTSYRGPAHAAGTIELRPGPKPLFARSLQLELKKVETLPGGGPGSKFTELIGAKPTEIWSVDDQLVGPDAGRVAGRGWAQLGVRDFPFKVAIPEGLPPSVVVDAKGGVGISYELCATLFARPKPRSKGLFHRSKDALEPDDATLEPVQITVAVPLRIVKHDLHSAWPIYHPDPPETKELEKNGVTIGVTRNTTAVGPGDELWTRVRVESEVVRPIRIIRFEISLREVIMFKYGSSSTSGGAGASNGNKEGGTGGRKTDQRMTTIFDVHAKLGKQLYHKEQHSFDIKSLVPSLSGSGSINGSSHQRLTVSTAKHLSIEYLLKVRAVVDGIPDNEIVVDFLPVTMGDRGWQEAQKTIERIGPVDKLMKPPKSTMKHVENRPHPGAVANQRRFAHQHPQNQTSTSGARGVQVQAPSSPPMPGQPGFPVGQSGAGRSRTSMPPMARSASGDAARTNRHTSMMFDSPAARASAGPGVRFSAHPDTRTISSSDGSSTIDAHDDPYQRRGPQPISSVAHKGDGVILDYGAQRSNRHSLELGVGSSIPPSSSEQRPSRSNQVRPIDAPPSSAAIAQRLRESKARIASFNAGSPSASPNRSASTSVHSESRDPSPVRNSGDRSKFATAEEEKKRLFEQAKRTAEKTQAEALARSTLMNGSNDATGQGSSAAGGKTRSYASAEEEKRRLFEEAKQEAERTQRGERSASDATIKAFSRAGASPDGVNESGSGERGGGGKQRTFESAEDEKKRYERARVQQEEAEERARQFYARQAQTPNAYPSRETASSFPNSADPSPASHGHHSLQSSPDRSSHQQPLTPSSASPDDIVRSPQGPLIDPHEEAFLKAIAEREAYVKAHTGSPLLPASQTRTWQSALEEKERLRKSAEGGGGSAPPPHAKSRAFTDEPYSYQPLQEDPRRRSQPTNNDLTRSQSTFSATSTTSSSADTAQYHRDPAIAAGKMRAVEPLSPSTESTEYGSPGGTISSPPMSPTAFPPGSMYGSVGPPLGSESPTTYRQSNGTGHGNGYLPPQRMSTPFDVAQMMNGVGMAWTSSNDSERSSGTGKQKPPVPPKIPLR